MNRRTLSLLAGAALTGAALAACSSGGSSAASPPAAAPGSVPAGQTPGSAAGAATELSTATSPLGTIVVDGTGLTAYVYDADTANSGRSSCGGGCAAAWPAVDAAGPHPTVAGITGTVGTITGASGHLQVTIDGRPLYTYAGDTGPGDVSGQGVGGIWHVVAPDGSEITGTGGTSSTTAPTSGGGGVTY